MMAMTSRSSQYLSKPFLKWAGGKYRIVERILAALPAGKRLVEVEKPRRLPNIDTRRPLVA